MKNQIIPWQASNHPDPTVACRPNKVYLISAHHVSFRTQTALGLYQLPPAAMLIASPLCTPGEHISVTPVMPKRPDFILQVSIRNIEDFSPNAIVKSPRTFRPQDVANACRNVELKADETQTPPAVLALTHYLVIDFFALSHSSGLYNRQIKLWENISKTASVEIHQMERGFFSREKLPEFDFSLLDHKKRPIALAHFAKGQDEGKRFDYLKSCREFLKRAENSQGISGLFLCYPQPFPESVIEFIKKETNASDKIAKYESLLPKFGVPVNLIEIDSNLVFNPSEQVPLQRIRLVHPDLGRKKTAGSNLAAADLGRLEPLQNILPEQIEEIE